jgi:hypothetical protein
MKTGVRVWLAAALAAGLPLAVHAQAFPPPVDEPPPAAQPAPPEAPPAKAKKKKAAKPAPPEAPPPVVNLPVDPDGVPPPAETAPPAPGAPPARAKTATPSNTVACSGAFAKNSSHIRLAQIFGLQSVTFTEVDGPENTKLMASVLYPKDPKRHLEVLWSNDTSRSGTRLIVINGQSTWAGPKGLHLGLPLAALEKLNGKPFPIAGFDQDNPGQALDWQGGALDKLPGGCKVGVRLAPDAKASADAKSAAGGKSLTSNDAAMHAVNPKVAEIIIGY